MPQVTDPQASKPVNLDARPFVYSDQDMDGDYAIQAITDTFSRYESERRNNYDSKWIDAEGLYQGVVQIKMWDNSSVPRASIPNNIAFDHVEGAVAEIESAFFDSNDEWFGVDAMDDTDPRDAKDIQREFQLVLDVPDEYYGFATARRELRLGFKDICKLGEGMLLLEWDPRYKRPRLCKADLTNVYVDPDVKSPSIDEARSVIVRDMISVNELRTYNGVEGVKIPRQYLGWAINNVPTSLSDQTQRSMDAMRGLWLSPDQANPTPIPADRKVEILRYYDKGRIIWLLDRRFIIFKMPNVYKFYPIIAAPCRTESNRFYGMGYPWAIRWKQKVTESLYRGMLDEVSLAINPPTIVPKGDKKAAYSVYPGRSAESSDAKSVVTQAPPGIFPNMLPIIADLESKAERSNGINASSMNPSVAPGRVRTAAGVQAQQQGSNARLAHVIKNIEDYMIIPLLYKMRRMYQVHVAPDEIVRPGYVDRDGNEYPPIMGYVFHRPVRFRMEAATRLLTRQAVSQALPFWMQFASSGQMMEGLASTGRTIDFDALTEMAQYATGTPKKFQLIRPLTEQEQQARNTPPAEMQMQMQAQQQDKAADRQLRYDVAGMKQQSDMAKVDAEIQKAMISKQSDPMESQMKFAEQQAKLQVQQQQSDIKLRTAETLGQIKMQQAQSKAEADRQKMIADIQEAQMKLQAKAREHQMNMRMQQEAAMQQRINAQIAGTGREDANN